MVNVGDYIKQIMTKSYLTSLAKKLMSLKQKENHGTSKKTKKTPDEVAENKTKGKKQGKAI